MNRSATRNVLCCAGLAVFTLYLLVVNEDYYRANTRAPSFDEAWYLETSLYLYHRLTDGSLGAFLVSFSRSFQTKAPLISVLPVPFYLVFGTSQHSALLVNSLFIIISNIYLFLLVRRWFSAEAGLAAVVFYQTMPLAYGLSRTVMVEYGLSALVLMWLYYLVASEGLRRGRANFAMGVLLGLGLLMKVLFAAFVAGPLVAALWLRRREALPPMDGETFWLWRACARRPLAAIALPGLAIAGTWYAFNLAALLRFAWQSAYGTIAPDYSAGGLVKWLVLVINQGISFYYTAAVAVLGLAALAAARKRLRWNELVRDSRTLLLLGWLVPPLAALAAAQNQLIRFALPMLPVLAIVLSISIFQLGSRWIVQAALAVILAIYPQRLFAALSYAPPAGHYQGQRPGHSVHWGPFVLFSRDLGWAHPPVAESPWERRRLLEALRRLAPDAQGPHYVVVGVEHVYLNADLLNYLRAYYEYPFLFTSLGYAESSADKAVERIYAFNARFLIMTEGFHQLPGFLNRANDEIQARLDKGELPFRLRAKVPLAHQMKAIIYERDEPWERFEPGSKPPVPARPLRADLAAGVRLLGYDWKRKDRHLWELTYYWTALQRVEEDYGVNVEFRGGDRLLATHRHFVTDGRHPFPDWEPGEVVKQSRIVYLGPDRETGPIDVRLWLTPWGVGPAHQIAGSAAGGQPGSVQWRLGE